jgi:Spy/CpxP family protein refolding chaperone
MLRVNPEFNRRVDFLLPFRYPLKYHSYGTSEMIKKALAIKATRYLSFFCFLLVLFSSHAFSQPSGMRMGPGIGMRHWREENRGYRAWELNLSSVQAKELELIQQIYFRETQVLRAQLLSKRLELWEFLRNPTTRIESIRSKYSEINETESRFEEKAIEYLLKVRNLLTSEQLRSWNPDEEFSLFRRMMRGVEPMGPIHPRRSPPLERFREE